MNNSISTTLNGANRILCALDTTNVDDACRLATEIAPYIGGVKLGLEFFGANGPVGFEVIKKSGSPIFLDLKLHDIPNTVAKAIHSLMPLAPSIMTIHTAGGPEMMKRASRAATDAAKECGVERPIIVGVTILTSLDENDLDAVGYDRPVSEQVVKLAKLAKENGLDGVVCSPHEITAIKEACGKEFKLVVPGIRPAGSDLGDQKRIMTPEQAIEAGADYIVIGRPITQSDNPVKSCINIAQGLS